jgi:two-component system, NtrC family, sensor kinase
VARPPEPLYSEGLFQSLVESLPQCVFSVDLQGRYTYGNSQYLATEKRSLADLLGKTAFDFDPKELAEKYRRDNQQVAQTGVALSVVERHQIGAEQPTFVQCIKTAIYDAQGKVSGVLGVFWDVTPLMEAEAIQKALNQKLQEEMQERTALFASFRAELERQVLERTQALNSTLTRQQELNLELTRTRAELLETEKMAALGGLVAGVAHEINTPVGISLTSASHLLEATVKLRAALSEGALRKSDFSAYVDLAHASAQLIQRNAERAAQLIQSFKQISVDQTTEERREYDLQTYVNEVMTSLRPALRQRQVGVTVRFAAPIMLDGYPGAMAQVLTNLTMNALIHAFKDEGHAIIEISVQSRGDEVEMRFSDNGAGIEPKHLGKIFSPFFTTRRGEGGTGLGLNIIYNIMAQQFAGSIAAESVQGEGTCFSMRFPRVSPLFKLA